MSEYDVEKNIPIPPKTNVRASKYPYGTMEIGDSFFVESVKDKVKDSNKKKSLSSTAHRFGKTHNCYFVIRDIMNDDESFKGFRVFRDELPPPKTSNEGDAFAENEVEVEKEV